MQSHLGVPVSAPPSIVDVIAPRKKGTSAMEAVRDRGQLPPLGRTGFDPRLERRAVSKRSLAALLVLAVAATGLIIGALRTLGPHVRFAATPAVFRRAAADPGQRTDRLAIVRPQVSNDISRSRVEQLNDNGLGTTPFTHLVAHLTGYAAPAAAELAELTVPREILHGSSQAAALPDHVGVSAYAASDEEAAALSSLSGEMLNSSVIVKAPSAAIAAPRVIIARPGDTLTRILQILGTAAQDVEAISGLLSPRRWLSSNAFAGDEKITVLTGSDLPQGPVHPLKVSIERPGRPKAAVARADSGSFVPVVWPGDDARPPDAPSASDNRLRPSSDVSLRDGLYGMAASHGVDRTLIDEIVRLSGHDVDLDAFPSASDSVEILFRSDDGGEPELAFAALTLDGRSYRYYRFTAPDDNSTDYYDADGRSVTQSLLRKPVAAGRLGDGYGWRMHPVLGVQRMHEGVDYTAPFGSPVVAAAAGAIELISEQPGYGKYVRIRHDLGYETTYAHLSGVPRGLHVGERVRQGQTIAFVGSTGYSTGSHLYYEVRINGRNVDPLRVKLRGGRVLDGSVLAAFEAKRERSDLLLRASMASAEGE